MNEFEITDKAISILVSGNINKAHREVPHESSASSNTQIPVQKTELNDATLDKSIEQKQFNVAN